MHGTALACEIYCRPQSEQLLLEHVFPESPAKSLASIFDPSLNALEDFLTSQIATIKKSLTSTTFYAFGLYETLVQHQADWRAITSELDFDARQIKLVEEASSVLRGACLRSFPEVLVDIRTSQTGGKGDTSSIADVTYRAS